MTGIVYCMAVEDVSGFTPWAGPRMDAALGNWVRAAGHDGLSSACRLHRAEVLEPNGDWGEAGRGAAPARRRAGGSIRAASLHATARDPPVAGEFAERNRPTSK